MIYFMHCDIKVFSLTILEFILFLPKIPLDTSKWCLLEVVGQGINYVKLVRINAGLAAPTHSLNCPNYLPPCFSREVQKWKGKGWERGMGENKNLVVQWNRTFNSLVQIHNGLFLFSIQLTVFIHSTIWRLNTLRDYVSDRVAV